MSYPWAARAVQDHIGEIRGIENLPATGSFILSPNHSSYFDHFLTIVLVELARGVPLWILTKKESFDKPLRRAWTEAWYGIPVDRDRPGPSVIRALNAVLSRGDGLGIYPEGTRGPGDQLLPFKDGAFRLALKNNVPVVPVAILGANRVLPPGSTRFRRGRVHIAFGTPLLPDSSLSKDEQSADLSRRARAVIEGLLASFVTPAPTASGSDVIDKLVAAHLDDKSELPAAWVKRLTRLTRLYIAARPEDWSLRAQLVRLNGLGASHLRGPRRLWRALRVRRDAERVVRHDPNIATALYVLGRWHLSAPSVLGADASEALRLFTRADRLLPANDTRALVGQGDALERLGRGHEAAEVYRLALERLPGEDPRTPLRQSRLRSRLHELESARA